MSIDQKTKNIINTEELLINIKQMDLIYEIETKILSSDFSFISEDATKLYESVDDKLLSGSESASGEEDLEQLIETFTNYVNQEIKKLEKYAEKIQQDNPDADNNTLLPKLIKMYYPMEQILKDIEWFGFMTIIPCRYIRYYYTSFIEEINNLYEKLNSKEFKESNSTNINKNLYDAGVKEIKNISNELSLDWLYEIEYLIGKINLNKIKDLVHYIIHKSNTTNDIGMKKESEFVACFSYYSGELYGNLVDLYDMLFRKMRILYKTEKSSFWNTDNYKETNNLNMEHFYPVYAAAGNLYKTCLFKEGFDLNTLEIYKTNRNLAEELGNMEFETTNELVELFLKEYKKYPFKIITSRNMFDTICAIQYYKEVTDDISIFISNVGNIELSHVRPYSKAVSANLLFLENNTPDEDSSDENNTPDEDSSDK